MRPRMWQGRLRLAEALKKVDGAGGNDDEPDHMAMGDTLGFAEHINQMSIGDAISKLELALKAELEVANPKVHRFEPPQPRLTHAQGLVLLNPARLNAGPAQMQDAAAVIQQLEENFESVIQFAMDYASAAVCPLLRLWPHLALALSRHHHGESRSAPLRSGR